MNPYPLAELNHLTVPRSLLLLTFTSTPSDLILSVLPAFRLKIKRLQALPCSPSLRTQKVLQEQQTHADTTTDRSVRPVIFVPGVFPNRWRTSKNYTLQCVTRTDGNPSGSSTISTSWKILGLSFTRIRATSTASSRISVSA